MTSSERAKDKRLRETYNQTLEEHHAKRAEQLDACAICRRPFSQFQPYQDHDHACCPSKRSCGRCIRGLLCMRCNMALGLLGDDEAALEAALRYLR